MSQASGYMPYDMRCRDLGEADVHRSGYFSGCGSGPLWWWLWPFDMVAKLTNEEVPFNLLVTHGGASRQELDFGDEFVVGNKLWFHWDGLWSLPLTTR